MEQKKILVVDDDPDFRALIGVQLKAAGFTVVFAQDGMSGISTAQRERPDLIVLDLHMPAGNGQTILRRLKSLSPLASVPVIVASATPAAEVCDEVMEGRAAAFLQKPITGDDLLAAVNMCFGEKPGSQVDCQASLACPHCHKPIQLTATQQESAPAGNPPNRRPVARTR